MTTTLDLSHLSRTEKLELVRDLDALEHRRARSDLMLYTQVTFPRYDAASHLGEVTEVMESVERGELDRVMVFMPPRHGKSLLISQRLPAWYLSRNPTREVIHSSYGGELVSRVRATAP